MTMLSFEDLVTSFENCQISDGENVREALRLFIDKLSESYRFVHTDQHFSNTVTYKLRLHDSRTGIM